jgi:hypothetical protein
MTLEDVSYHSERAERELQLGLTAPSVSAARSHLQLSSLHKQKVLETRAGESRKPRPPCIIG